MHRSLWLRLIRRWLSLRSTASAPHRRPRRTAGYRPVLEQLEDRVTPAYTFDTATSVQAIIGDVNYANTNPGQGPFTIPLQKGLYVFDYVDNNFYGHNALPPIAADITIQGNGAFFEIQGNGLFPNGGPTYMRYFYVSGGEALSGSLAPGSLTLQDMTLEGGIAKGGDSATGGGGLGAGGAIFNQGTLTLNRVTLKNNEALGGSSGLNLPGATGGGGIGIDAKSTGDGGGFSTPPQPQNTFGGSSGGNNGNPAGSNQGGGGGGGFNFQNGPGSVNENGGNGGGVLINFGGIGGQFIQGPFDPDPGSPGIGGDGGGGASIDSTAYPAGGGVGGNFGFGGIGAADNGGGGGGGIGGGGGGSPGGGGGGGGFGGGGGAGGGFGTGGYGGFGGGGGAGGYGGGGSVFGGGVASGPGPGGIGGGGAGMGGAIFNLFGTVNITNSTLAKNSAQGGSGSVLGSSYGGALLNLDGTVTLNDDTLATNEATEGSAVYNLAFGHDIYGNSGFASLTANNSILSNNAGGSDLVNAAFNLDSSQAVVQGRGNLIQYYSSSDLTIPDGFIVSSSDPLLGPLQFNGGLTETMAITPNSPAYGAGYPFVLPSDVDTDQRGWPRQDFTRVNNFLDIGAYEYNPLFIRGNQPGGTTASSCSSTRWTPRSSWSRSTAPRCTTTPMPFSTP